MTLLLPASARAQLPLDPPQLPNAGETVATAENTVNAVADDLSSAMPTNGTNPVGSPSNPAPAPSPAPDPASNPAPAPTGGGSPTSTTLSQGGSGESVPVSTPVPAPDGQSGGSGKKAGRTNHAGDGPRTSNGPRASAPAAASAEPSRDAGRGKAGGHQETSVLERFINVIPAGVKIALGVLAALFLLAAAVAGRSRRQLAAAQRRALTDGLTGLPNRRHMDEVIERALAEARRSKRPLAAILFDLDRFKAINDNYGHAVGDDVLRATADAVRELLRGGDHVARFGGEEFVVLLPHTSGADALGVAEKMRVAIAGIELEKLDGGFFTASFGVAAYPDDGATSDELFSAADEALYRAKEAGRNRVERPSAPLASQTLALA